MIPFQVNESLWVWLTSRRRPARWRSWSNGYNAVFLLIPYSIQSKPHLLNISSGFYFSKEASWFFQYKEALECGRMAEVEVRKDKARWMRKKEVTPCYSSYNNSSRIQVRMSRYVIDCVMWVSLHLTVICANKQLCLISGEFSCRKVENYFHLVLM